jgi:hypothetical protein
MPTLQDGAAFADRRARLRKVRPVGVEMVFFAGPFLDLIILAASQNSFEKRLWPSVFREGVREALRSRGACPCHQGDRGRKYNAARKYYY